MCTFIKEERMKSTRGNKSSLQYHFAYMHFLLSLHSECNVCFIEVNMRENCVWTDTIVEEVKEREKEKDLQLQSPTKP
jgi:hypothetical protein